MNTKYPIYIISKGRHESRLTSKTLEMMNVDYKIVVEPQEYDLYASVIKPSKILILPFSNLGIGSVPARNWCWEHSIENGHERHWLMDDNINYFFRLNKNMKIPVSDGTIFNCMESFTDRYENIALSGPNYFMFASRKTKINPFTLNTRVYSCTLIKNDLPYRWRGRWNEDTDLNINVLKAGFNTILFNAFLQGKSTTMMLKGGNSDDYAKMENRKNVSQIIVDAHPDVAKLTWKFGRYHHHVDYSRFKKNKLIFKPGLIIPEGVNNFGMKLIEIEQNEK